MISHEPVHDDVLQPRDGRVPKAQRCIQLQRSLQLEDQSDRSVQARLNQGLIFADTQCYGIHLEDDQKTTHGAQALS